MSLQVWLPLNGDLRQQGLSNLSFNNISSTNTTINNSGKIGKCYSNDSHTAGGLISDGTLELGQQQSMFCWFKFTDLNSVASLGGGLVSQHRAGTFTGMGITIRYVSATTGYLSVNTGNGSSRTYNTYYGTTLLQANTWYHGGYTYDGSTIKIYVNGICEKTQAFSGMSVPADYISCFCWNLTGTSGNTIQADYKFQGSLNDVRVYNHCLSETEVKKLAQGLIVHYPLNRGGWGQENLLLNTNTPATWSQGVNSSNYAVHDCFKTQSPVPSLFSVDELITISFDWSTTATGGNFHVECGAATPWVWGTVISSKGTRNSTSNYIDINASNQLGHVEITFKITSSQTGAADTLQWLRIRHDGADTANKTFTISNAKLERGSIATPWCPNSSDTLATTMGLNSTTEYDCSGFCNNGTRTGTFEWSSDTPKYSVSTKFGGSNYIKTLPGEFSWSNYDNLTIAAWMKPTATPSNWTGSIGIAHDGSYANKAVAISNYGGKFTIHIPSGTAWGTTQSTYTIPLNTWHHCVATVEGTVCKMYVDGVLNKTFTIDWGTATNHTNPQIEVGVDLPGTDEIYNGYYSDVRIYATALSASDVKSLYQNCATIGPDGTIYGQIYS